MLTPSKMIRIYSWLVLLYDVVYLGIFTCYSILQALYRIVCPRPVKSVQDEVAVVSEFEAVPEGKEPKHQTITLIFDILNAFHFNRLSERVGALVRPFLFNWAF